MSILTRDRIYFLLKDPCWSFIWWQVDWRDAVLRMMGGHRESNQGIPSLRVHDVTDIIFDGRNSHRYVDIEGVYYTDHWYFQLPSSGRNYCAEIGIRRGDLFVVARSNTLFVPRAGPSESHEESWSTIETTR